MKREQNPAITAAAVAAIICLLVYLQAINCGFVNLDDPIFVVNNPNIRALDYNLLVWAFSKPLDLWIPFSWISLALDYHFWKLNPIGYHFTNIILHAVNSSLVVLIADRLLRARSQNQRLLALYPAAYACQLLLAGLLFAIHPLKVESVVWVSERKDFLNGMFSLGCCFFLLYVHSLSLGGGRVTRFYYLLSLSLFIFSLLSKPVSVVIPFMLLLIVWYPLGRFKERGGRQGLSRRFLFLRRVFGYNSRQYTAARKF